MINLKQDAATINDFHRSLHEFIADHKEELLSQLEDAPQAWIVRHYINVLRELSDQASKSLLAKAYSTAEALSRVIIEQSANLLYVAMDSGDHARALLKRGRTLGYKNGKNWVAYLSTCDSHNAAAQARLDNGAVLVADAEKRWPNVASYPGTKDLFSKIDWEDLYHAYYAPLCDSVHSFSDDLSNIVGIGEVFKVSASEGAHLLAQWEQERRRLATYHCAVAVTLPCEALGRICQTRDFPLLLSELKRIVADVQNLIVRHEQLDHARITGPNPSSAKVA